MAHVGPVYDMPPNHMLAGRMLSVWVDGGSAVRGSGEVCSVGPIWHLWRHARGEELHSSYFSIHR